MRRAHRQAQDGLQRRTNTLKAASDGYVNRSATSSMMPQEAPSMYDPATGTLRPTRNSTPTRSTR
jgi:hypothetical protein